MSRRCPEKTLARLDTNALAFRAGRLFARACAASDRAPGGFGDDAGRRAEMLGHLHRAYVAAGLGKMHASMGSAATALELSGVAQDELFLARDLLRRLPRLRGVPPRSVRELIHRPVCKPVSMTGPAVETDLASGKEG